MSSQLVVHLLFKGFNHESSDLVGDGSANRGIERVDELELDGELDLGRRRCRLASDRRQVPERLESLEDGRCVLDRAAFSRAAAASLDGDARDTEQTAREGLVKAAPAHVQVGEGRPAAAGVVGRRPFGDARVRAVGHKGRVGIDVCNQLVEGLVAVGESPGGDEALGGGSGEGDEGAARGRERVTAGESWWA